MSASSPSSLSPATASLRLALLVHSAVLLLLALLSLASAHHLQAQLGRSALTRSAAQLAPLLTHWSDFDTTRAGAQRYFADASQQLGLRRLRLQDRDGTLLVSVGAFDHWRWSGAVGHTLENIFYALLESQQRAPLYSADGRYLGRVDFDFSAGDLRVVHDSAVQWLHWLGIGLLAMLLLSAPLWWLLLRRLRSTPQWLQRADPQAQSGHLSAPDRAHLVGQFRARAGTILDAMGYALTTTDAEGRVTYLNSTAERLSGWTSAAAAGRMIYSVFHTVSQTDAPLQTAVEAALKQGEDAALQRGWLRSRDGQRRPIEMMATLNRRENGAISGGTMMTRDVSGHLAEVDDLRREARLSQAIVDHLEEGVLMTDAVGVVRFANARAEAMFGYSREELQGFTITKLMPVPFLNTPGLRLADYISSDNKETRATRVLPKVVGWRKDATTFPVELWVQTLRTEHGEGLVVIVRDTSERQRSENLAMRLGRLLDAAVEEVYIFDAQSLLLLEVNRSAARNLGFGSEAIPRMTPLDISRDLDEATFRGYLQQLSSGVQESVVYRCRHRRADDSLYPVEVRLNFSHEEEPAVFMAMAVDISERLAAEERLQQHAHHDALSGLPNRLMLLDRLERAWLASQRGGRLLGVLLLDLDHFKAVNEQYGHALGDQVLQTLAQRLQASVRPSDTVARLRGDRFAVLAPGLRAAEDAEQVARKLCAQLAQPLTVGTQTLSVGCSIGVTVYPLDDADFDTLLAHADLALVRAKQEGRGRFCLYAATTDAERQRQLDLQREIRAALALDQLQVLLTPITDGVRLRALRSSLQWQHPRFGCISHRELADIALQAGIVGELELLQLRCVAALVVDVQTQLPTLIVDVSGWQLRGGDFARQLSELLQRYPLPAEQLVLALSVAGLNEASRLQLEAARLLQSGVRLALYDFQLPLPPPIDTPVQLLIAGARCHTTTKIDAVAALARQRELPLLAFDVPQQTLRDYWQQQGIALGGSGCAAPVSSSELRDWLRSQQIDSI